MIDDARGQSTVEAALLLPLIALVLAAVVEVGLLVGDQARVWHAAREAARVAVVDPDASEVRRAAERTGLRPLDVTIEPAAVHRVQGRPLTVTVVHRPRGRMPLVGSVVARLPLRARATMRIEQP